MITDSIDIKYLAGLIDGEGCFSIQKRTGKQYRRGYYFFPRLFIRITDKAICPILKDNFGGYITFSKSKKSNHKDAYRWTIQGKLLTGLLKDLIPHLIIKKQQANILLQFRNLITIDGKPSNDNLDRRELLYKEIKKLNRRGKYENNS